MIDLMRNKRAGDRNVERSSRNQSEPHSERNKDRSRFRRWIFVSLIAAVIAPSIAAFYYLTTVKTPLYASEARVSVRSNVQEPSILPSGGVSSLLTRTGISTSSADNSDVYAIQNFLLSRNAILSIGGMPRLLEAFGNEDIDSLSRIKRSATLEDALVYWRGKVSVYIDSTSGILILRVKSFNPETSLKITEDLLKEAEQLLNDMSKRSRRVALEDTEQELRSSASAMSQARAQLLEFQSRTGVIDPVETVSQIGTLIANLRLSQLERQGLLETSKRLGSSVEARRSERETEISILEEQIRSLEDQLTGQGRSNSIASTLRDYELLKMEEEFSSQLYKMNRTAYERARRRIEEQQQFIVRIVQPMVAERPSDPRPVADAATLFGALFVLWGIVMLLIAAVRDR